MKAEDVLRLVNAGYTKEEIAALETAPAEPAADEETETEETEPAETEPAHAPENDNSELSAVKAALTDTQKQLAELVKQMQKNNLKTASVDILPADDLEKRTDAAMAELIRPTIEGSVQT